MEKGEGNSIVSRRIEILGLLKRHGQVNAKELSESLGVSRVTIRNDLTQLEKKSVLISVRGGAIQIKQNHDEGHYPLSDKQRKHHFEKVQIGEKAAELIEDSDTIIINSGSTTFEMAKNLKKFKDLTVITNALDVASLLAEYNNINVIVLGGMLKKKSLSLVCILDEKQFKAFLCDKLFLDVDGFDLNVGISTTNLEEAHLNQIMIRMSKEVIVVADSSKFQRRGFAFIAPVDKIRTVVTNKGILPENKAKLKSLGVKVITA